MPGSHSTPLPVGPAPWAELRKLARCVAPGPLPWHLGRARGKQRGQCQMVELWRQWASVAPGESGSSRATSSLWF